MSTKKKLIEVALPLEAINKEASREKSIRHGHPSTLHLWWARRPLAACRAVLFASLVDDPSAHPDRFQTEEAQDEERQRLFRLIEELVKWESSDNDRVLRAAREEIRKSAGGNPPPILDPFCGGGSIPLEAQRLGLEVHASDLNPVAVLITKGLIEIPSRFRGKAPYNSEARGRLDHAKSWHGAQGLAEDVRYYGGWLRNEAESKIKHLFPHVRLPRELGGHHATAIAWLWSRTVKCPDPSCGADMPLLRSFWLSEKRGNQAWIEPVVHRTSRRVDLKVCRGTPDSSTAKALDNGTGFVNSKGKRVKATFKCIVCGQGIATGEYIDAQANSIGLGVMPVAIVAERGNGRVYIPFDEESLAASSLAGKMILEEPYPNLIPTEPARGTFASNAQGRIYGFKTFANYFTARQLIALCTFCELIDVVRQRVLSDLQASSSPPDDVTSQQYADAVATYISFAIGKGVNLWSSLASWMTDRGAMRETFAQQGLTIAWSFAEANPFSSSGGNFTMFLERVIDVISVLPAEKPGIVKQLDAAATIDKTLAPPMISTDPPYYGNISYAELSDFFYVWLRRAIGKIYPDVFATVLVPKAQEMVATPFRFGGDSNRAREFFENAFAKASALMRSAEAPNYPLTVYYAFKQAESEDDENGGAVASTGWEAMLEGLLRSGFGVTGTWPMRTESAGRTVASGTNALASSIVLVCRPRSSDAAIGTRRQFITALKAELPRALQKLQRGNIAPVDFAQAAIGPGMAVYSNFAKVVEADGSPMRVRTALALINQVLDEGLAAQEGEFDSDTRWAVTWFEQHGFLEGPFGDAETLSKAKDTSVNGLVHAGIVAARGGKVRLLRRDELDLNWDPIQDRRLTAWEVTQQLSGRLETKGEVGAALLLKKLGSFGDTVRDLAYRLYVVCERNKWSQEAIAYNSLVTAWPEIVRLTVGQEEAATAQAKLGF